MKWKDLLRRMVHYAEVIVGAPNYEQYVAHMSLHHPEEPIMSRKEFYRQAIDERYNSGSIRRCC